MKSLAIATALLLTALPASAELNNTSLPNNSQWYLHVDLAAMRKTNAGEKLYGFLNEEVFDDLREDTGFDPDKEVDRITAYSSGDAHATVVVLGDLRQASEDKLLAAVAANGQLEALKEGRVNYYRIEDIDIQNTDLQIDQDILFLSFDKKNAWIFSTKLEDLVAEVTGNTQARNVDDRSLLVLTASKPFVQAGVDSEGLDTGWNSGMLRNARQLAFRLSDDNGQADIELRITAKDEQTSNALASIVRGLIGLQALSGDMDTEVSALLSALKVENDSEGVSLKLNVAPEKILIIVD